jgi:hypothetical protein
MSPEFCAVTRCLGLFCIVLPCPQSSALSHAVLDYSALSCTVSRVLLCHTLSCTIQYCIVLHCSQGSALPYAVLYYSALSCIVPRFFFFIYLLELKVAPTLRFCTVKRCPGLFCVDLHCPASY